ncbi:MAG: transporter associated domain-containing protein [Tetrasphaera sp.]
MSATAASASPRRCRSTTSPRLFDIDLDDEHEVDTVGGLIAKEIGRVPILGSRCEIGRYAVTAERMAGRRHRIASVLVEPLPPVEDSTGELALPARGNGQERAS